MTSPYDRYSAKDLILRDWLAIDRTILANERTFLSYVRTGIAFFVTGLTGLHFFDESAMQALGVIVIALGIVVTVIGYRRYRRYDRWLQVFDRQS